MRVITEQLGKVNIQKAKLEKENLKLKKTFLKYKQVGDETVHNLEADV